MRPTIVIVVDVFAYDEVKVLLPEDKEMVQSFLLETLNPSFNESVQIGRLWADRFHADIAILENLVEHMRKCAVPVAHHDRAREPLTANMT